ncbi:SWIM zinc finger family protein [Nonomuraea sp. NPDC003754]
MNSPTPTVPPALPPVAPHVVAAAVEVLTSRLRKKLDAAVEQYAAVSPVADGDGITIRCGEDAVVTLSPGTSGAILEEDQARCSCLLSPRCLHRAAVLSACPVADAAGETAGTGETNTGEVSAGEVAGTGADADASSGVAPAGGDHSGASPTTHADSAGTAPATRAGSGAEATAGGGAGSGSPTGTDGSAQAADPSRAGPSAAQVAAAAGLWAAAAAVLSAGVPAAGAVPQAELLRAAHTARLAGLPNAEAAAVRVVRGLRAARERHDGHRLADLVSALRELLLTAGRLALADPDPALVGSVRRSYQQGGSLRAHGVFREPVISATGYGGVVTHLVAEDGRWFSVADVKPGGAARARGAATATVAIGSAMLSHAQLARAGLLIVGATVSPDGRLGAGRGVRATPLTGIPWTAGPLAALFARPLAESAAARLSDDGWSEAEAAREPVGCDLVIVGTAGDAVLARELWPAATAGADADGPTPQAPPGGPADGDPVWRAPSSGLAGDDVRPARPGGPLIRLVPAGRHPGLAHLDNLRRLASRPGMLVRVVGRVDPDRAATLIPLAVGPVPGAEATLRLPADWHDRADLGYDRLQRSHLPPDDACLPYRMEGAEERVDPVAGAPLWRVRRLVELAVAGGRRAVAEPARNGDARAQAAALRGAGFLAAADLVTALTAEADRRARDVFGRLAESDTDRYAWAWLAAAAHLAATERALVRASWQAG